MKRENVKAVPQVVEVVVAMVGGEEIVTARIAGIRLAVRVTRSS
jgi:hypothetical protein